MPRWQSVCSHFDPTDKKEYQMIARIEGQRFRDQGGACRLKECYPPQRCAYQGPTIPTTTSSPPKIVERETEVTKDTVLPTNNRSTEDVQPLIVQVQPQVPSSEPAVAPVSAPMPNSKPSIPYPSRRNDEKRREKSNDQIEKFYKIFQV
ncbi:hypothetical protein Tco_1122915 [Tanacetum coccineum]|uniref:Uncharacterized protein n=1 Tax=Tanacetum coccineum TaxID=301880 RepID=A0ABQ5J3L4_9ASTR